MQMDQNAFYTEKLKQHLEQNNAASEQLTSDVSYQQQIDSTRIITLNHKFNNKQFAKNMVKTQKYSWPLFLPLSILDQFKVFSNQYFLFISLTQIFPSLKINFAFTYYLPLMLVICTSLVKDFNDDFQRYKRDKKANSQKYRLITDKEVNSSALQPGDLIVLKKDERAPADVVVLQTLDERGLIYIRTDSMDGEIDWKTRKSISLLQQLSYKTGLEEARGIVQSSLPDKNIYQYNATYLHITHDKVQQAPLNYENTIWQNCVVANSECVCLVVNTGRDTRSAMNTSAPRIKEGRTDIQMNLFVKGLFVFLVIIAAIFTFCSPDSGLQVFLRFFIIYSDIIPVSLKVCMEVGKALVSIGIRNDKSMSRIQVNTTSIPEQLGKITHIFSDKTGTLTKNVMVVQKVVYDQTKQCCGAEDVVKHLTKGDENTESSKNENISDGADIANPNGNKYMQYAQLRQQMYQNQAKSIKTLDKYNPQQRLHYIMKAMATCHSVALQNGELLASSPDEVALVKFAQQCGYSLTYRDDFKIKINEDTYMIKYIFPFTSVTKRMSIILYDEQEQKHFLFVKGADTVIEKLLIQEYSWLKEKIDQLSYDGLRTLVYSFKELSDEQYNLFDTSFQQASCLMLNREQKQLEVENQLLSGLFLLGMTGIEDQLQDGVQKSLEMLRSAGIRTWILSGDKVQTIQCIALSSRLIDPQQTKFYVLENMTDYSEALHKLQKCSLDDCLVIDGTSLTTLLGNRPYDYFMTQQLEQNQPEQMASLKASKRIWVKTKLVVKNYFTGQQGRDLGDFARNEFARISSQLPAVCCCRCSPDQKALICKLVSTYTQSETAGIGDGANDVSLLQAASVGFGIFGKEGVQAAMAADFAIGEFKDIQQLIFWHGRISYKNTVEACQFIIQRGMCSSFIQAFNAAIFFFVSKTLFTGVQMLGYSTIFNIIPVICMYLNEDVDYQVVMKYPELYKKLLQGRLLNTRTFFIWSSIALSMSQLILFTSLKYVDNNQQNLILVSFTTLVVTQLLLICLTVQRWSWFMVIGQLFSLIIYILSIFVQMQDFSLNYVGSFKYYSAVIMCFLSSGVLLAILQLIIKVIKPTQIQKLRFTQGKSKFGKCNTSVHTKSSTGHNYFNF